jgi:ABC-type multidrug transport system fused ATPase/permease subunit
VVAICFAILLPVMLVSYFYGRKMRTLTRSKNDELEKQVGIISGGNKEAIQSHYNALRKWQVKISDKEAFNFGMIEIMVLLVIGASLLISTNLFGTTMLAGNLIGMYNYILKFVSGLDTIPYTVQRIASLTDITRRIELQDDDFSNTQERIPVPNNIVHQQLALKLSA